VVARYRIEIRNESYEGLEGPWDVNNSLKNLHLRTWNAVLSTANFLTAHKDDLRNLELRPVKRKGRES